ncbi:sugar phosphate isomerase/epimerase family protein [Psychrobacillus vulpis]|uniref:Sugar phosphate isomerase/epimerase n=1 Tax=Psychrobacillus vulpis TaxID=2325572 RepID=A0A544TMJ7_9BACI|nr:sugar phosphate isomerase/epimerase [Psychrobacillus vulpis]TQR18666.1 sugar phosphate isomerase/epimerase [Psychrobacillus vulpis]
MKKSISYSDLVLLSKDIIENVKDLIQHGADKIELLMDGQEWNEMEGRFQELASQLQSFPVTYTIHPPAWDINLTSENLATRETAFSEYKKSIQFAGMIGASHVVIHPGFCFSPVFNKQTAQQRATEYINELCKIAKELGVKLAIENVGYNGSSIFTQNEYTNFLNNVDETAGFLIDTGHAHLNNWNIRQLIKDTKDRLLVLHIHDNDGTGDHHLPIGEGTIEWEEIFAAINEYAPNCEFILEYAPNTPLEKLHEGKALLQKEIQTNQLGV